MLLVVGCGNSSTTPPPASTPDASTSTPAEPAAPKEPVYIECGGAGNTTFVYSALVAMAEAINGTSDFVNINVQTTSGTTSHYQMIADGLVQMASGTGFSDNQAWNGKGLVYTTPMQNQCTILVYSLNFQSIFVPEKSPVQDVMDLEGKKVGVGAAGTPSADVALGTLRALGFEDGKNITIVYSTVGDAVEMYKDGNLDAIVFCNAAGSAGIVDATTTVASRWISLTEEQRTTVLNGELKGMNAPDVLKHEHFANIPEGTEIQTINDHGSLNVTLDMEDDVVTEILTIYWDQYKTIKESLSGLNGTPESILLATTYVHPAAAKYYKDVWNIEVPAEKILPR